MSKNIDLFIEDVSRFLFEREYPFVRWDSDLHFIELIVYDKYENKVREIWDRRMIEQEYSSSMSNYISYMVHRKFIDAIYYKEKLYTRW